MTATSRRMRTLWLVLLGVPASGLLWLAVHGYGSRGAPAEARQGKPTIVVDSAHHVECRNGVVVSVSGPASDVGLSILKQGGNAVDAAVATAFALAVAYPPAGNLGGGGFMLVHPSPGEGEPLVFDYRECAPAAAWPTMFAK